MFQIRAVLKNIRWIYFCGENNSTKFRFSKKLKSEKFNQRKY